MKNNKGLMQQLVVVLIMFLVIGFIVVAFYAYALVAPSVQNSMQIVTTQITSVQDANVSHFGNMTIGNVSRGLDNTLPWLGYSLFIFGFLGFFIVAFFVRTYPFMGIFWAAFMIVMIFTSVFMSVSYDQFLGGDPGTAELYRTYVANDFILSNLPVILTVMLLLGGLILFLLVSRDSDAEAAI